MTNAFIYGVILAFGLILPLGVQNIFVFNQGATQKHFVHALPSVVAAAFCDTLLILLAVLGVSVAVLAISWLKTALFVVGFFFLLYMGWVSFNAKPSSVDQPGKALSAKRQILFALSVSLLNPHAILDTIGVIGTTSLHFTGQEKWAFTSACILVSCLWFVGLSLAGHMVHKLDKSGRKLIILNKVSAFIIWGIALYFGFQLLQTLHI